MPAPLSELVAVSDLRLRVLVPGDAELSWAHGSDLDDPTPFVEPGQLLLTTGRQFVDGDPAAVAGYVRRLADAGVAAIGFGTEVVRDGTPQDLVDACRIGGMPLVEVPYDTPFIAVSRWIAERHAADAHRRLDQTLATQTSVSSAAIGAGGLPAALARAADGLGCRILLLDPDGEPLDGSSAATTTHRQTLGEARGLLAGGRRSSRALEADGGHVLLRTLGAARRLRGVLAFVRAEPFDAEELSLVTTVTALAELSLENRHDARESVRALLRELLPLLADGRIDAVRAAIAGLPAGLPGRRLRVVEALSAELGAGVADSIERRAADPAQRTFHVQLDGRLLLLVDDRRWPTWRERLVRAGVRAGVSDVVEWRALPSALIQAGRALEQAPAGGLHAFSDLVASSLLGLLGTDTVADIARVRLTPLAEHPEGAALLAVAEAWLRHNAHWDAAARELGIHRHTLKTRMHALGDMLGLDLDRFADRAELWALLAAREGASATL